MIIFQDAVKSYDGRKNAIDHVSLEIRDGEIFGFLGRNGAGKTTAIHMMTGIIPITSGSIQINGFDVEKDDLSAKRQIGYVSDDPNVFLRLKGIEYLNFVADMYEVPSDLRTQRIEQLAGQMDILDALEAKIQSYSHGMRQKIVVVGSLLHDPAVWILDEPMTGLDPKSSFTLKEMMRRRADSGKTVLFSTHILDTAEKVCDRIAVINRGKILFCGTLPEMREHFRANESLEQMFLEITEEGKDV